MTLITREQIKEILLGAWDEIESSIHPLDVVQSYADDYTPIYNSEIISEWRELPFSRIDVWRDHGFDTQRNDCGIIRLMQVDLMFYYYEEFDAVFRELRDQREELEECPEHGGAFDCTPFCPTCQGEQETAVN